MLCEFRDQGRRVRPRRTIWKTKQERTLELTSVFHECQLGRRDLEVKVVDIFGNDTMTIAEVTVGKNR